MATALKEFRIQLSDPSLFREQAYIDGAWVDADDRATIKVDDPASGEVIGRCSRWASPRPGARSKRRTARSGAGAGPPPRSGRRSCASGLI